MFLSHHKDFRVLMRQTALWIHFDKGLAYEMSALASFYGEVLITLSYLNSTQTDLLKLHAHDQY